jgi:cob(I)alamin adenosyltransferase
VKIYTKTGDSGETSLFGGQRVKKNSIRIAAYGNVDELNAFIGYAAVENSDANIAAHLEFIQNDLFILGSDLATPMANINAKIDRIDARHIERLEQAIDRTEQELQPIRVFILPGGTELAARLHLCRTICRRAERSIVELQENESINDNDVLYVNRLSDFLFVIARYANKLEDVSDIPWIP